MKSFLLAFALLLSTLILFPCKKDNPIPPGEQPQASLSLEDVRSNIYLNYSLPDYDKTYTPN